MAPLYHTSDIELEHFEAPSSHLSFAMCPTEEHLLPGGERRLPGTLSPTQNRVHAEQPLLCRYSQLAQTHRWVTLMPTVSPRCSLNVPLPIMLHHHIISKSGGRVTTWTKSGTLIPSSLERRKGKHIHSYSERQLSYEAFSSLFSWCHWPSSHQIRRLSLGLDVFFFFSAAPHRILVPRPGIEPLPLAVKVQSPNRWTTREFLALDVLNSSTHLPLSVFLLNQS